MPPPTYVEHEAKMLVFFKCLDPKNILFFVLKLFLLAISWGGGGGEVQLFGGEASPAPPSLDETLYGECFFH